MHIIKVGGGAGINLKGIVRDLATLDGPVLVVLGANAVRDDIAERLGRPKKTLTSVSGYESVFSDEQAMDAIMMAYPGLRRSRFVELCQQNGVNALGLSGVDGSQAGFFRETKERQCAAFPFADGQRIRSGAHHSHHR